MTKVSLQVYLDQQWQDAAEIRFYDPELGHRGSTRLDYLPAYALEYLNDPGATVSSRYPVDFVSHDEDCWPAFLLDLLPGGEGRRRWAERLSVPLGIAGEIELLKHAAANPTGNLRVRESIESDFRAQMRLPDKAGHLTELDQHPGFGRDQIIEKQEHFIEYAYQLGAAVADANNVQGEAPKFLVAEDLPGNWHAEGALADSQVRRHWIVKFARGKAAADQQVLRNEAGYLEVARQFGLDVGEPLQFEQAESGAGTLFIPRFDRAQTREGNTNITERYAMESLYALAGVSEYGAATPHEVLVTALMAQVVEEDRPAIALEYIKRDLLNVVMGNTDNHGRNTAVLRSRDGRYCLSPLFDFAPMYLDPEGIARVCRWDGDKEQSGRPVWREVIRFFATWVEEPWLLKHVAQTSKPLERLSQTMASSGIDDDIIARCQFFDRQQLKSNCGPGVTMPRAKIEKLEPDTFNEKKLALLERIPKEELSLGVATKAMRLLLGMTQEEYGAKVVGLSRKVVSAIERDSYNPELKTLEKIARPFGLKIGFLR
ncbi:MAG: HipA domain-containing protein [Pseudomonadales bacterium]|jgi:serine/threonine-protein kinase HipA